MLDIKPIMKMNQGKPQMEIVRTRRRADQRVVELVRGLGRIGTDWICTRQRITRR